MTPAERGLRVRMIEAGRRMNALGINQGKSGNVSVRIPGGFLVTPTGVPYEQLNPPDLVFIRRDGQREGTYAPSSEWRLHRDIYEKLAEVGAVVHTHSPHATSLACLRRTIPAFHYEVAVAGGVDIRCADYATFGTQELSDHAIRALDGRRACLLANHGVVATGTDLDHAFAFSSSPLVLPHVVEFLQRVNQPALM